jgi:hypothetical protein
MGVFLPLHRGLTQAGLPGKAESVELNPITASIIDAAYESLRLCASAREFARLS